MIFYVLWNLIICLLCHMNTHPSQWRWKEIFWLKYIHVTILCWLFMNLYTYLINICWPLIIYTKYDDTMLHRENVHISHGTCNSLKKISTKNLKAEFWLFKQRELSYIFCRWGRLNEGNWRLSDREEHSWHTVGRGLRPTRMEAKKEVGG